MQPNEMTTQQLSDAVAREVLGWKQQGFYDPDGLCNWYDSRGEVAYRWSCNSAEGYGALTEWVLSDPQRGITSDRIPHPQGTMAGAYICTQIRRYCDTSMEQILGTGFGNNHRLALAVACLEAARGANK